MLEVSHLAVDAGIGFDFRRTESGVSVDGLVEQGEADTAQAVAEATMRSVTATREAAAVVSASRSQGRSPAAHQASANGARGTQ